ncbi:hypothetical protein DVH24_038660, partial [Malus domestica]
NQKRVKGKASLQTFIARNSNQSQVKVFTQPHCLQNFVQSTFNALPSDQVKDSSLHIHLLTTFTLSLDWMDFYNFHDQRMHEVRRKLLLLWSFFGMGDKERGLRGHAKESILLAIDEYTSYNSNVMMGRAGTIHVCFDFALFTTIPAEWEWVGRVILKISEVRVSGIAGHASSERWIETDRARERGRGRSGDLSAIAADP